jgi:hypothetical protein
VVLLSATSEIAFPNCHALAAHIPSFRITSTDRVRLHDDQTGQSGRAVAADLQAAVGDPGR